MVRVLIERKITDYRDFIGRVLMLIRVIYDKGHFDMVKPQLLDQLLMDNSLQSFKRSDGWVLVDKGPIRNDSQTEKYYGPERRRL